MSVVGVVRALLGSIVSVADKKSDVPESVNCVWGNAVLFVFVGSLDLDLDITRTVHHPTLPMSQANWNRPQHPSKHPQRVDEPPAAQHRAYPGPVGVGLIDEQLTNIRSQFEHILQQNHLLKAANDDLEAKCAYNIVQIHFILFPPLSAGMYANFSAAADAGIYEHTSCGCRY